MRHGTAEVIVHYGWALSILKDGTAKIDDLDL